MAQRTSQVAGLRQAIDILGAPAKKDSPMMTSYKCPILKNKIKLCSFDKSKS
jgi:hypothetical protein